MFNGYLETTHFFCGTKHFEAEWADLEGVVMWRDSVGGRLMIAARIEGREAREARRPRRIERKREDAGTQKKSSESFEEALLWMKVEAVIIVKWISLTFLCYIIFIVLFGDKFYDNIWVPAP